MISATRMLCQKYTDLTDAEISYLESYGALLPALANAEQADVFIDCRTVSGRSAIVVCEAKPQTVPSNYRSSILGMLIHWRDEPAVDRSFRLAVPTSGVRAVSMPEDRRIVQSVEPLFYEGRLMASSSMSGPLWPPRSRRPLGSGRRSRRPGLWTGLRYPPVWTTPFFSWMRRTGSAASTRRPQPSTAGWVTSALWPGCPSTTFSPPPSASATRTGTRRPWPTGYSSTQRLPLSSGQARAALIIHDLTRQRQLEEELALQRTALQELRHRMKNNLQMLANLTRSRGCDPAESPPVQTALLDTANRLLSLAATLDGIVQVSREKVSLLQILEQIRRYMLQTLLPSARRVTIHVGGEDVIVSADCASSVALVVNELVQNALKYAFPSGQAGRIGIELHSGRPLCQLTVWDNGVGFQADRPRPGGAGLELASTIVREKLTGEWSVESGPGGTRISFDFLEQ